MKYIFYFFILSSSFVVYASLEAQEFDPLFVDAIFDNLSDQTIKSLQLAYFYDKYFDNNSHMQLLPDVASHTNRYSPKIKPLEFSRTC